jgi:predicted amidohydrolase
MRFAPNLAGNLARIEKALQKAAKQGADVVLFPECATTGYRCNFHSLPRNDLQVALAEVGAFAAQHRINVLMGTPVFQGPALSNGLVVFDRAGQVTYVYAKCQLTAGDKRYFAPGDAIALFQIDGIPATAIICHERRYPELVRLAVMAGARLLFHPNAGLDTLAVSRRKRGGRDGMAVRAFENAIPYVFANSVGPQGDGKWSAGDSKIVGADGQCLRLAGNHRAEVIVADVDLHAATGKYAMESLESPRYLRASWKRMVALVQRQAKREAARTRRSMREIAPIRA